MLALYIAQLRAKGMNPAETGAVVAESGCCLTYDGRNGLGQVVADRCSDHAIRLVRGSGLAMVVARNSNHFGTAAYWAEKIARSGAIGIVLSNASPAVPPWQGRSPRLGTNPIAVAVPGSDPRRWQFDMATTTVALGKVGNAANYGQASIPAWWGFLDAAGNPTTDTRAAQNGMPTPIGGYKGSGLAMMIEILSAVLGGGPMSAEVPRYRGRKHEVPLQLSQTFLAIDTARFMPLGDFESRMGRLKDLVKSSEPAKGYSEVLIAGEPEWRAAEERRRDGIPVPSPLWESLLALAAPLNVVAPRPDAG
jgi:LDH2 family malate/lactate/ureidoglycolate dehydrogenase